MAKKLIYFTHLKSKTQRGGAYLRNNSIIEILKALGYEVDVRYSETYQPLPNLRKLWAFFIYGANSLSLFKKCRVDARGYDLILLDNLSQLSWNIKRDPNSKIFINLHNIENEIIYTRRERGIRKSLFKKFEYAKLNTADAIFPCSEREKEKLISEGGIKRDKIFSIPNMVAAPTIVEKTRNKITFLGSLNYFPNIIAVDFLLSTFNRDFFEINPSLKNFEFVIAGQNPADALIDKIRRSPFKLRQNLSDQEIRELLTETYISLVPLTEGSGTRLKIAEALSFHNIVISTPLGCEGYLHSANIKVCEIDQFSSMLTNLVARNEHFNTADYQNHAHEYITPEWIEENLSSLAQFLKMNIVGTNISFML